MSASASEFQHQFTLLFKRTSAVCAVLTLSYFFQVEIARGLSAAFMAVFTGSAAITGTVVVSIFSWGHYMFWSRAKWSGTDFGNEANQYLKLMYCTNAVGGAGGLFLYCSLFSQVPQRDLLDHILGLVAFFLLVVVASHKGRMQSALLRIGGHEHISEGAVQFAGSVLMIAPIAIAFAHHARLDGREAEDYGLLIGVLSFFLMRIVRLPEVGDVLVARRTTR